MDFSIFILNNKIMVKGFNFYFDVGIILILELEKVIRKIKIVGKWYL